MTSSAVEKSASLKEILKLVSVLRTIATRQNWSTLEAILQAPAILLAHSRFQNLQTSKRPPKVISGLKALVSLTGIQKRISASQQGV
jgi:hypothetical protein